MSKNGIACIMLACCLFAPSIFGMDIFVVNQPIYRGNTLLHLAVWGGDVDRVQSLIAGGAKVDLQNDDKHTPLYLAVRENNEAIVQVLLHANANVNIYIWGQSPLIKAILKERTEIAKMLIGAHAELNFVTQKENLAPLHFAVTTRSQSMVKLLLANGANVNVQNNCGETPLIVAIREINRCLHWCEFNSTDERKQAIKNLEEIAKALLNAGAKVDVSSAENLSARQLAHGHNQDIEWIISDHVHGLALQEAMALLGATHPRLGVEIKPAMRDLPIHIYQDIYESLKKFDR